MNLYHGASSGSDLTQPASLSQAGSRITSQPGPSSSWAGPLPLWRLGPTRLTRSSALVSWM